MMNARDTFARALAGEDEPQTPTQAPAASNGPPTTPPAPLAHSPAPIAMDSPVVDVRSGEILPDLEAEATDRLAGLLEELVARRARFKAWQDAIDAILRARLEAEGRRMAVVGDYELAIEGGRAREWDPDDLELAVHDLLDKQMLSPNEVAGLITSSRRVDGNMAKRLLSRLGGDARRELESCYRWKQTAEHVKVTRSVNLADALPDGAP